MAGMMPHAIFVETGLDGGATVAAYAAELPGCAAFADGDSEAVAAITRRVLHFSEWLRRNDDTAPAFVGDNWYEVERAACDGTLSLERVRIDCSPAAFSKTSTRKLRPSHRFSRFQKKVNSTRDLPASSAVRRSTNHRSRSLT